jgi:hypothetical protein
MTKLSNSVVGDDGFGAEVVELVKRTRKPRDLYAEYLGLYGDLIESRIKSVRRHREPGPHGGEMGRWFVEADWPADGSCVTSNAGPHGGA